MEVTYQIKESELNYQFFQGLKKTFKGKKMTISIKEQSPNKLTKEEFEVMVLSAQNSDHAYSVSGEQWEQLLTSYENDESYDVVSELQKHRVDK